MLVLLALIAGIVSSKRPGGQCAPGLLLVEMSDQNLAVRVTCAVRGFSGR
jgi:hypothetical protein